MVLDVVPRSAKLACLVRLQVASLPPCVDLRERRSRLELLTLLDRLPRPFDRLAGPAHVTGSAIVTSTRGTILQRHKRLGTWLQPGGHLEPGEAPWEAALREASEETISAEQVDAFVALMWSQAELRADPPVDPVARPVMTPDALMDELQRGGEDE